MKFNKTIEFKGSQGNHGLTLSRSAQSNKPTSEKMSAKMENIRKPYPHHTLQPLSVDQTLDTISGQEGRFKTLKNDFSLDIDDDDNDGGSVDGDDNDHFRNDPKWSNNEREEVKQVRFVICILALLGLAFALMSRLMLNVSIVVMVEKRPIDDIIMDTATPSPPTDSDYIIQNSTDTYQNFTNAYQNLTAQEEHDFSNLTDEITTAIIGENSLPNDTIIAELVETTQDDDDYYEDGLHFNWTKREQTTIIGSFYIGYMPGILLSGGVAQRYGAKYPLFVCVFGTAIINILTPTIARFNVMLLIASRIVLGLLQGSLFPALYELFNRWLTATESSIFAPLIKVSMPLGSVIGSLLPGVMASAGLEWPYLFYLGGSICLLWSLVWFYAATSRPQANQFIEEKELQRIMRKKKISTVISSIKIGDGKKSKADSQKAANKSSSSTPWLLIMTNPSVIALTLVKYTYNMGMDFIALFLPVYLREAHGASVETISAVASCSYCTQMILITFIGWLAKTVIARRTFGLSVTKWRKIFQGGSNFAMAGIYLILGLYDTSLVISSLLMLLICLFWMLGAGGESMIPYDLSTKYPASIVGLAHSISILSGVSVPAALNLIVGEDAHNADRWRLLFLLISGALAFGGLVFVLIVKAKPFLPSEKAAASGTTTTTIPRTNGLLSDKTAQHNIENKLALR